MAAESAGEQQSSPFSPIEEILEELRQGKLIVLCDDEDRENEGDLVCAAEFITPDIINFMLKQGRGTLCVPLTQSRCQQLNLPPQTAVNNTQFGTAFTVTIDAGPSFGVTTGVSASDRAITIRHTVDEEAVPEDFVRPGHVNPLIARDGGVLVRAGQTEGSVDLCRLAGLMPAAAIIEVLNEDGTMARVPQLTKFCQEHGVKMCTIASLIEYRMQRERLVERIEAIPLRNRWGDWTLIAYRCHAEHGTHVALCMGDIGQLDDQGNPIPSDEPAMVRVHSECLTGDVFGSSRCDCGDQLNVAMATIAKEGRGAVVYLRQEGRGIGLGNKIRAYKLQDEGLDTVEANIALGLPADPRDYGTGAQILRDIGLSKLRILTNNPKKTRRLQYYGLEVVDQVSLEIPPNPHNRRYLEAKKQKMGHELKQV